MKNSFSIEITKKDKTYLYIILFLLCAIIIMAICLPRPYKVVEKEVVVEAPVYINVYETQSEYIISPTSSLYLPEGYTDLNGNTYRQQIEKTYVDTGAFQSIKASISVNEGGTLVKKEMEVKEAISNLIVNNEGFAYNIKIDNFVMANIKTLFALNFGGEVIGAKEIFLLEINFEKAKINILISYISE